MSNPPSPPVSLSARATPPRIALATAALPAETLPGLAALGDVGPARDLSATAQVLVTDPGIGADAATIASMPQLRLIACYGVGVDAVALEAAARRGIAVSNTPGLLADAVADMAMALLLSSARNVARADAYVRAGAWTSLVAALPLGRSLKGRRLGIVGLGAIGTEVALRAAAFGLDVAWHGPRPKLHRPWLHVPNLLDLARWADFLVLTCRGGADTNGIVDRAVIEALGPTGTLVNVARGSVVDEAALVECLADGRLGFAALDVFAREPAVPEALRTMENVVLTPHIGSASHGTRVAMAGLMIDNVRAFLEGRPLPTPVALPRPATGS